MRAADRQEQTIPLRIPSPGLSGLCAKGTKQVVPAGRQPRCKPLPGVAHPSQIFRLAALMPRCTLQAAEAVRLRCSGKSREWAK